jgi:hypothetical protein
MSKVCCKGVSKHSIQAAPAPETDQAQALPPQQSRTVIISYRLKRAPQSSCAQSSLQPCGQATVACARLDTSAGKTRARADQDTPRHQLQALLAAAPCNSSTHFNSHSFSPALTS